MKKLHSRETIAFLTTLMACGAFLVGAVKLWGVSSDKIFSGLITVLLMLGILAVLALLMVILIKVLRRGRDD